MVPSDNASRPKSDCSWVYWLSENRCHFRRHQFATCKIRVNTIPVTSILKLIIESHARKIDPYHHHHHHHYNHFHNNTKNHHHHLNHHQHNHHHHNQHHHHHSYRNNPSTGTRECLNIIKINNPKKLMNSEHVKTQHLPAALTKIFYKIGLIVFRIKKVHWPVQLIVVVQVNFAFLGLTR